MYEVKSNINEHLDLERVSWKFTNQCLQFIIIKFLARECKAELKLMVYFGYQILSKSCILKVPEVRQTL